MVFLQSESYESFIILHLLYRQRCTCPISQLARGIWWPEMMSSCPAKSKVCRVIESSSVPSSDLLLLTPRTAIATSTNNRWCGQPTGTQSVLVKTPYPCLLCIIETSATKELRSHVPRLQPASCAVFTSGISSDHIMKILGRITTLTLQV